MNSPAPLQPKPTAVYIGPLDGFYKVDIDANLRDLDHWLRSISHDLITVERLKSVAENTPILANIFAAVDVISDIRAMINHGDRPLDLFDWLNLGLDLIGVIPVPAGTAEVRMGARPLLKLVREEVAKNGRAVGETVFNMIRDGVISAMLSHLQARYAGEIEKFIAILRSTLAQMLGAAADYIGKLMNGLADLFEHAGGKHVDTSKDRNNFVSDANQIYRSVTTANIGSLIGGVASMYHDGSSVLVKTGVNATTATVKYVDADVSAHLTKFANALRQKIPAVQKAVRGLDGNDVGKIGWLLQIVEDGVLLWRKSHPKGQAVGIPSNGKAKAEAQRGQGPHETLRKTADAQHPGGGCCNLNSAVPTPAARSGGSIGFALGDERIDHDDFTIDGPLPIIWVRTYRSFFDANDAGGELGPRWITPYTVRFDVHDDKLVYHDAEGRSLDYPLLDVGAAHDDPAENMTLLRLDDRWLSVTRGHDFLEAYERDGDRYRLAFLKDRAGNQLTCDYDAQGRLYRLIAPHVQVAFKHDARGRILEIVEHDAEGERVGRLAAYEYDAEGDLAGAWDRFGNHREYRYRHHLLTRYTDRTGRGMNLEWHGTHAKARCFREYRDDGSDEVTLAWHPDFRMVSVTDALGNVTQHYYDIKGYTFRVIHPDGSEEWLYRNAHGKLVEYIHRDGGVEFLDYDARGNFIRHRRVDGSVIEMEYDAKDQLVRTIDPQGHAWTQEYDDAGNVVLAKDPLGHETKYQYNGQGLPIKVVDAKGGTKSLSYDAGGRLLSYRDCSGKTTQWSYDAAGRLSSTKDAAGTTTAFTYGANGQLAEIVSPAGVEKIQYDAEGRLISTVDPMQRATRYSYDGAGRVSLRVDALGQRLSYGYDRLGRLVRLTDANDASYTFRYDPVGRLLEEVEFDGKTTRYAYDEASGRLDSIDEAGRVTRVAQDGASRVARREVGEEIEQFAYDASGRLIDASNRYSRVQRFFDPAGNLVREHHAYDVFGVKRSYVWHHGYDELGNRVRTVRPDGHTIDWLMYGSGHVHGLLVDGEDRLQLERDDLHREVMRTLSSRIGQSTVYDPAGRIERQTVQRDKAPAALSTRRYRYDAAGQLTLIEDSRKGATDYRYDPVGRLIEAIGPGTRERFAFDPASNIVDPGKPENARTSSTSSLAARSESTLPASVPKVLGNLLKEYAGTHFDYDEQGNLIQKRSPGGRQRFEWDGFDRMSAASVEEPSRHSASRYYYDALGRRIAKEVNGAWTVFGWDGDTLAYESSEAGSTHYVYEARSFVPMAQYVTAPVEGIETPVARADDRYTPEDDPLQRVPMAQGEARVMFYHCDQIGTPLMMTDEAGEVVWEASYKAWGETREVIERASAAAGVAVVRNPLRFQGQQVDDETGLHYNRYRYYDPSSGRFVSQDPVGLFGGVNPFAYADNPVAWIDPLGLAKRCGCPCGVEPHGNQPSPRPSGYQSHHIIQDRWAKANDIDGYNYRQAPAILIPQNPTHKTISDSQNTRRDAMVAAGQDPWSTSIRDQFNYSSQDMRVAGVSDDCRKRALKKAYKYFDKLEAFK
ncbi:RHS repeat-associated core domain-containing protein [Burkholderia plantarii]|uniref:RHS repeat-associated core domain-containing protein n=1 Tax=Burkholderia plantarii TaxID=41899 RepID=UPI0018DC5768|nr:RHS repeat-associated core domain-containing protein [Burkholderia plantarii]MBI0328965.1 RHS domain-containing protein [Burkholderia plantarii]